MKTLFAVAAAVLLSLAAGGCSGSSGPTTGGTHALSGTVRDQFDAARPGVTVSLSGATSATAITDADGGYAFAGLSDGRYEVSATRSGYRCDPPSLAVTVAGSDVPAQDFRVLLGAWTPVENPVSGRTDIALTGVWGSGLDDVWAVGSAGTILRWDGVAWTSVASGTPNDLLAVFGTAPDDVWAVGSNGTILRWRGIEWTTEPSGTLGELRAVWGSGPDDAWAVGSAGWRQPLLLHWDGGTWGPSPVPAGAGADIGNVLWGTASNDVWTSSRHIFITGEPYWDMYHWNGDGWSQVSVSAGIIWDRIAERLWGSSSNDVWALGSMRGFLHWQGDRWTAWFAPVVRPDLPYMTVTCAEWGEDMVVQGAIWGSSADDVWAMTFLPATTVCPQGDFPESTRILHFDGQVWSAVETDTIPFVHGIWGAGPDDVWAVGDGGTILRYQP